MASQPKKIQSYMEKHKIGALFESLMSQLVKSLPEDPLEYLERTISEKRRHSRQGIAMFRKSATDLRSLKKAAGHMTPGAETLKQWQKDASQPLAGWAAEEKAPTGGVHAGDYDKPWRTNSRKTSQKPGASPDARQKKMTGADKPSWNSQTRVETHSFDEFFETQDTSKGDAAGKSSAKVQWATEGVEPGDDDDLKTVVSLTKGYSASSGEHRDEDELPIAKAPAPSKEESELEVVGREGIRRPKSQEASVKDHKLRLQQYLQKKTEDAEKPTCHGPIGSSKDSGVGDNGDSALDDALEAYENEEDLIAEGVKIPASKGKRVQHPATVTRPISSSNIQVGICARCAKVMQEGSWEANSDRASTVTSARHSPMRGDTLPTHRDSDAPVTLRTPGGHVGEPARSRASSAAGDQKKVSAEQASPLALPSARSSSHGAPFKMAAQTNMATPLQSARRTGFSTQIDDSDDEFESISQVSGPRAPVWDGASDMTPRKGHSSRQSVASQLSNRGGKSSGVLDKKALDALKSSEPVDVVGYFLSEQADRVRAKPSHDEKPPKKIGQTWQLPEGTDDDASTLLDFEKKKTKK